MSDCLLQQDPQPAGKATRKELLALVQAVQHFYAYLYGRHFTIQTALKWLLSFKKSRRSSGQVDSEIGRIQLKSNTD